MNDALISIAWYDIAGLAGTVLILLAYFAQQAGRIDGTGTLYPTLNLFGAAGVLASLVGGFNLSVFLLESCWVAVSAFGIWRSLSARARRG